MIPIDAETRSALSREDWEELTIRLLYFAHRYSWLRQEVSGAPELEDLVQDAILAVWTGVRTWPRDRVRVFGLLCGIIRSRVSHILEIARRRQLASVERMSESERNGTPELSNGTSDGLLLSRLYVERIQSTLMSRVRGDSLAVRYLVLLRDGDILSEDVAASRLGVSVAELRSAKKRLRRRLSDLRLSRET